MNILFLIDACLILGLMSWVAGFVLQVVERRRQNRSLLENGRIGGIDTGPGKHAARGFLPTSKRVLVLLAVGIALFMLATVLSWYFGVEPRASEAAAELQQLKDSGAGQQTN